MLANYNCPACSGRLVNKRAQNAFRCRRCDQFVIETIEQTGDHVRAFFARATGRISL